MPNAAGLAVLQHALSKRGSAELIAPLHCAQSSTPSPRAGQDSMLRRPLVARASGLHTFLVHQRRHVHHADLTCTCASYRVQAAQTPAKNTLMAYGGRLVRSQVALYPHPFRTTCAAASSNGTGNGARKLITCRCPRASSFETRQEQSCHFPKTCKLHPLRDCKEET